MIYMSYNLTMQKIQPDFVILQISSNRNIRKDQQVL